MITSTDFAEKQILFVDPREGEGKFGLRFQNSNLLLTRDEKPYKKISAHRLLSVFIIGDLTLTTKLIEKAGSFGISIFLLKRNFGPYAQMNSSAEGNYLLRMRQYSLTEKEELKIAKEIVKQKIKNQARLLGKVKEDEVKNILNQVDVCKDVKTLLGYEGNYASIFFKEYFKDVSWRRRAPRTKEDIPNLLLDIGYTILFNFLESFLRLYGFDVYKGVYHKQFFARKSLVSDVQEPFRSIIDKALLRGYKLGIVDENDFSFNKNKKEFMLPWKYSGKYYRMFSEAIMDRKMEIYDFVYAFYRHVMLPEENDLKTFNINKNYHNK